MRKTMRWSSRALMFAIAGGLLLTTLAPTASAQRLRQRVVIVQPVPVFDPFFPYAYPDPYRDYAAGNLGYVKIDTHRKDAAVYVDGGYAAEVSKAKKFAFRPGTHDIELSDSDHRTIFHERIAVLICKTTKIEAPS
jgi:hypothetical protein